MIGRFYGASVSSLVATCICDQKDYKGFFHFLKATVRFFLFTSNKYISHFDAQQLRHCVTFLLGGTISTDLSSIVLYSLIGSSLRVCHCKIEVDDPTLVEPRNQLP